MRPIKIAATVIIAVSAAGAAWHAFIDTSVAEPISSTPIKPLSNVPYNPDRTPYYGDLHLHTNYSFDAGFYGARIGPNEAYRFARGGAVLVGGMKERRAWPLDFAAVTDHAEYLGLLKDQDDPKSPFFNTPLASAIRAGSKTAMIAVFQAWAKHIPLALPGMDPEPIYASAWMHEKEAANSNYIPGKFTTFIAYEWTSHLGMDGFLDPKYKGGSANLHRNVIFEGDDAPPPFTSIDSTRPEDLWSYLEANRRRGVEAIAIPHNANGSNGLMYDWVKSDGKPIEKVYATRRMLNEPLSEIGQIKGQSETVPVLSPTDEFANFEIDDWLAVPGEKRRLAGSYIRNAYGRGLEIAARIGANPYKFGVEGSTDIHNGLSTSDENAVIGVDAGIDPTDSRFNKQEFIKALQAYPQTVKSGSGNLTGVWAESNTRESIYAALRRKETFATSGPRLKFRFFGGWDFSTSLLNGPQWVHEAYKHGVPMGGDLPAAGIGKRAPIFAMWAVKDPNGANLDRLEIIKVWLERGKHHEHIYDVALSNGRKVDPRTGKASPVGNTVDLKAARYTNSIGATELKVVWRDPDFHRNQAALYYLRVLEIPTPRWTTIKAVNAGLPLPKNVPATIQERGWSSPIWYAPTPTHRKRRNMSI